MKSNHKKEFKVVEGEVTVDLPKKAQTADSDDQNLTNEEVGYLNTIVGSAEITHSNSISTYEIG